MSENNKSTLINTNSPRDSRVFADGNYVIKNPVATNTAHIKVWIERQTHAKNVTDGLLSGKEYGKKGYFIPKIVEISETPVAHIREERVAGKPVTKEYFDSLSKSQQDTIYNALAAFICDMNQNHPILNITEQLNNKSTGMSFETIIESLTTATHLNIFL